MFLRIITVLACFFIFQLSAYAAAPLKVFVSIIPQKYFVQQIGKDHVNVQVMVQPGANPATYEPKPRQMAAISKTDLYFSIGVPFENTWLKKISAANPRMKVIHTDHGIKKIAMVAHHHDEEEKDHGEDHGHGSHKEHGDHHAHESSHGHGDHHDGAGHEEDHHDHSGPDPHIWLSPKLVKIQAETMLKALQAADPANKKAYEANFNAFIVKIDTLDQELKQIFAGKKGFQFMVFHPAWGYLADAYGLKQVPIEVEGKDPKPAQLKKLIKHARKEGIRVVFVQPQFSTKSAQTIASEIGGQVAFANPLAEDWMANLRMIAEKFRDALK